MIDTVPRGINHEGAACAQLKLSHAHFPSPKPVNLFEDCLHPVTKFSEMTGDQNMS